MTTVRAMSPPLVVGHVAAAVAAWENNHGTATPSNPISSPRSLRSTSVRTDSDTRQIRISSSASNTMLARSSRQANYQTVTASGTSPPSARNSITDRDSFALIENFSSADKSISGDPIPRVFTGTRNASDRNDLDKSTTTSVVAERVRYIVRTTHVAEANVSNAVENTSAQETGRSQTSVIEIAHQKRVRGSPAQTATQTGVGEPAQLQSEEFASKHHGQEHATEREQVLLQQQQQHEGAQGQRDSHTTNGQAATTTTSSALKAKNASLSEDSQSAEELNSDTSEDKHNLSDAFSRLQQPLPTLDENRPIGVLLQSLSSSDALSLRQENHQHNRNEQQQQQRPRPQTQSRHPGAQNGDPSIEHRSFSWSDNAANQKNSRVVIPAVSSGHNVSPLVDSLKEVAVVTPANVSGKEATRPLIPTTKRLPSLANRQRTKSESNNENKPNVPIRESISRPVDEMHSKPLNSSGTNSDDVAKSVMNSGTTAIVSSSQLIQRADGTFTAGSSSSANPSVVIGMGMPQSVQRPPNPFISGVSQSNGLTSASILSGISGDNVESFTAAAAINAGIMSYFGACINEPGNNYGSMLQMSLLDPSSNKNVWIDEDDDKVSDKNNVQEDRNDRDGDDDSVLDLDLVLPLPPDWTPSRPSAVANHVEVANAGQDQGRATAMPSTHNDSIHDKNSDDQNQEELPESASKVLHERQQSNKYVTDGSGIEQSHVRRRSSQKSMRSRSTKRKKSVKKQNQPAPSTSVDFAASVVGTDGVQVAAVDALLGDKTRFNNATVAADAHSNSPLTGANTSGVATGPENKNPTSPTRSFKGFEFVSMFRKSQGMGRRAMVLFPHYRRVTPETTSVQESQPQEHMPSSHHISPTPHINTIHSNDLANHEPVMSLFSGITPIKEESAAPSRSTTHRSETRGRSLSRKRTPSVRRRTPSHDPNSIANPASAAPSMPPRRAWFTSILSFFGVSKHAHRRRRNGSEQPGSPGRSRSSFKFSFNKTKAALVSTEVTHKSDSKTDSGKVSLSVSGKHEMGTVNKAPIGVVKSLAGAVVVKDTAGDIVDDASASSPIISPKVEVPPVRTNKFGSKPVESTSSNTVVAGRPSVDSVSSYPSKKLGTAQKIDVNSRNTISSLDAALLPPAMSGFFPTQSSTLQNTLLTTTSSGDGYAKQSVFSFADTGVTQVDPSLFPSANTLTVEPSTTAARPQHKDSTNSDHHPLGGGNLGKQQNSSLSASFSSAHGPNHGHSHGSQAVPGQPHANVHSHGNPQQFHPQKHPNHHQSQQSIPKQQQKLKQRVSDIQSPTSMASMSDIHSLRQRMEIYPRVAAAFGFSAQFVQQLLSQPNAVQAQSTATQRSLSQPQQTMPVFLQQLQHQQQQQSQQRMSYPSHKLSVSTVDSMHHHVANTRLSITTPNGPHGLDARLRDISFCSSVSSSSESGILRSIVKANPDMRVVEHRNTEESLGFDPMDGIQPEIGWVA